MTTTNDAAERLRNFFRDEGFPDGSWTFENLDAALAAERRATVERIRPELETIAGLVDEAIARFEAHGTVFDKWPMPENRGAWTPEKIAALDPETRWQGIAFTVYTRLANASALAQRILDAEAGDEASASAPSDR